eukprot:gene3576-4878_t
MKSWIVVAGFAALALGGCQKKEEAPAAEAAGNYLSRGKPGRYVAVGFYAPGILWEQLTSKPEPAAAETPAEATKTPAPAEFDPAAANLKDDDQILVVMDSKTGELRQCGNFSGHCIGFNPWSRPLGSGQSAPVQLLKHAQQLQEEIEAATKAEREEYERQIKKK